MKIYYDKDNTVIATHTDDQNIDPSVYGENVKVLTTGNFSNIDNILSHTLVIEDTGSIKFVDNERTLSLKNMVKDLKAKKEIRKINSSNFF